MAESMIHLNGRLVPASQALVGVRDSGLLHGASVFTTMRAHNGVVFRLARHLARLLDTAALLSLRTDASAGTLTDAVEAVLRANDLQEARMRITLTPGNVGGGEPTTVVTAEPLGEYPARWYDKGIKVVVTALKQIPSDPTYGSKTGCYLPRVLARREAAAKGAEEALWFTPDNRLAEACFCNVFLVLDGHVLTPPRDTPVLAGIVREAVAELCARIGIDHDDTKPLTVTEMLAAEEMFLTSSCSGIRPVVGVEAHTVGDGQVGKATRRLMEVYGQLLERECAPRSPAGRGEAHS